MKKLAVVAFGGNALLKGDEVGTIEEQEKNAYNTAKKVLRLLEQGFNIVITHGNGPQVGNILLRNEAGYEKYKLPKMPVDVCVADSQGQIGYMIERQMRNALNDLNFNKNVVTLVTMVMVDSKDEAFANPTKPIGPYYLKEEADLLAKANGWLFKEDARKRGWRRVVPSPKPLDVLNKDIVKELVEKGHIVIATGGGGIPIQKHDNNYFEAIEAVIDKDLASSLLALEIGADELFIITDVPKVFIKFNTPEQKALDKVTISEMEQHFNNGEFGAGSMGPKVLAGLNFIRGGGKKCTITEASELEKENFGTIIIAD